MYSQRNEEEIILKYAPPSGVFLDVGAFHFKEFSNVRALYERGWSGVLIEPSPECFCGLLNEYENNPRITLVNALVTPSSDGLVKFYSSEDAVGTSNEANYAVWKDHAKFAPIYVPSISINRVLATLGVAKADFISIDTEGTSFDVLKTLDLNALGCNLLCVEIDKHGFAVEKWLSDRGFSVVLKTAENYVAKRN